MGKLPLLSILLVLFTDTVFTSVDFLDVSKHSVVFEVRMRTINNCFTHEVRSKHRSAAHALINDSQTSPISMTIRVLAICPFHLRTAIYIAKT